MSSKVDLASLFEKTLHETEGRTAPYKTGRAELDAVQSRRKAMSMFSVDREYIGSDADFAKLAADVFARGLTMVLDPNDHPDAPERMQPVRIFVLHRDQSWRVPAFHALWDSAFEAGPWTASSEALEGTLLGYSKRQREVWLARRAWRQPAGGQATVYMLLSQAQRLVAEEHGRRCLGPASAVEGLHVFDHGRGHAIAWNARKLIPKPLTLARVAITWALYIELFGAPTPKRRARVIRATVSPAIAARFNAAMRSNVQFLDKVWA